MHAACVRTCPQIAYNITYYPYTKKVAAATSPVMLLAFDFHGGVEFSVPPQGSDSEYITTKTVPFDWFCPQNSSFGILKVSGVRVWHSSVSQGLQGRRPSASGVAGSFSRALAAAPPSPC